jgi:hypothetical protein
MRVSLKNSHGLEIGGVAVGREKESRPNQESSEISAAGRSRMLGQMLSAGIRWEISPDSTVLAKKVYLLLT